MNTLTNNKTYNDLLKKSQEDIFEKYPTRMPSIKAIRNLLQEIGADVDTSYTSKIKAGYTTKIFDGNRIINFWKIDINTKEGYYSRNTRSHAKTIVNYINEFVSSI